MVTDCIYSRKQLIDMLRDREDRVSHQAALMLDRDSFDYSELQNKYDGVKYRLKELIEKYESEKG